MAQTETETEVVQGIGSDYAIKYGFSVDEDYFFKSGRGLSHELVDAISSHKNEPPPHPRSTCKGARRSKIASRSRGATNVSGISSITE